MKRLITFFTIFKLLSFACPAWAQQTPPTFTQTIKGIITDKESKFTIPGVTVKLLSAQTPVATSTNADGVFRLTNVPVGRHIIEVTYMGYKPVVISELLVTTGKEAAVNVELEPASNQLAEVVVNATAGKRPLNEMAMASGRSFSPEETNRYAGGFFDPARMAQSFAGVVAGGDNNEIIVRGNSPKSLQWRLEGIEIINPNHFGGEGAAGGSVSMLNSTVLGTSDFYTGALAAEYSNATAGAFDLKFRKGNTDKREYAFTIGVLGAGITMEGPFKKGGNASYLLSYRYSSLDLLKKAGVDVSGGEGVPRYQDLSFNFVFPTKKAGTFSLFGIGGLGGINEDAKRDYTKWEERMDGYDSRYKYDAGSVGLKHLLIANNKLYFNNIISYSTNRSTNKTDTLTQTYQPSLYQKSKYINDAVRYAGTVNYRVSDNNTIRAGVNAGFLSYNFYSLEYRKDINGLKELINQKGNASTYDAFLQNKHDFGDFTLNTGVHANYFDLSKSWSIDPRIGLNWKPTADQQVSFAVGTYSRLEPLSYYFAKGADGSGTSGKLSPTRSAQGVLGYEKLFAGNLKFKSEVYYQYLYNVPVSSDPSVNFSVLNESDNMAIGSAYYRSLVNKGTGTNYGLELSLEKSLSKGYYFILTSSLFDSKFKALSKTEFNSTYNTQYVGNLVAGKEWAVGRNKKNTFGLNGKMIYAGGRKYSPIMVAETFQRDQQVIDQARVNTLTADPYIRVDFSASYRINGKRVTHYILLDIQNLLNRENNIGLWYNQSKRIIEKNKWIGIVPTINYRIEI
jgi:hypothetical protein